MARLGAQTEASMVVRTEASTVVARPPAQMAVAHVVRSHVVLWLVQEWRGEVSTTVAHLEAQTEASTVAQVVRSHVVLWAVQEWRGEASTVARLEAQTEASMVVRTEASTVAQVVRSHVVPWAVQKWRGEASTVAHLGAQTEASVVVRTEAMMEASMDTRTMVVQMEATGGNDRRCAADCYCFGYGMVVSLLVVVIHHLVRPA